MLVLNLLAFKNKKYTAYDHCHGNGLYGEIQTEKEPIGTLGFPSRLPCHIMKTIIIIIIIADYQGQIVLSKY